MQDLAGLRHLLIHVYWEINDGKIYDDTRQGLSDFDTYARGILEFVKQQNERAGE